MIRLLYKHLYSPGARSTPGVPWLKQKVASTWAKRTRLDKPGDASQPIEVLVEQDADGVYCVNAEVVYLPGTTESVQVSKNTPNLSLIFN